MFKTWLALSIEEITHIHVGAGLAQRVFNFQVSRFIYGILFTESYTYIRHRTIIAIKKKVHYFMVHSDQSSQKLSSWSLSCAYNLALVVC